MQRLKRILNNEWFRAGLVAVGLLLLSHFLLLRFVRVESTSMYATLLPGDLVGVVRWPAWTGMNAGDIAVFHDPVQNDRPRWRRQLLVKRVAGAPGDRVQLRDGLLLVNGDEKRSPHGTWSHLVRLREPGDAAAVYEALGLPSLSTDLRIIELPLNDTLREHVLRLPGVVAVEAMRTATGNPRHIFPFSPTYRWNGDDYGPITVPRAGDTITLTTGNLPLYDRLLTHYEGHVLAHAGNELLLDGTPADRVVVRQDYYFVLGDSRHFSADSRYWGFVPADHLVGRATVVVVGMDRSTARSTGKRWFRSL